MDSLFFGLQKLRSVLLIQDYGKGFWGLLAQSTKYFTSKFSFIYVLIPSVAIYFLSSLNI